MDTYRVTGPRHVAGAAPGDVVELDPRRVNVAALLAAGHIAPVPAKGKRREHADQSGQGVAE
ncbi:acetamidase/formamidase [Thermocatellispora tengchongensis]|uniref:Acetamidase/formamidase n=1 Tax=Thermocatellispora tengchongensis TaxID=1073253 RepID=A0A840NSI7_9ACTN|nr:hypothetical protein [Thermocatellispora tengchongensis]MBB5130538.1 acetamidase/formamidase [Thermocatellispora tengchongensis]